MKNHQFDELAKSMAQSVTRRETMKKFGFGITALALGAIGLGPRAQAGREPPTEYQPCRRNHKCPRGMVCVSGGIAPESGICISPTADRQEIERAVALLKRRQGRPS